MKDAAVFLDRDGTIIEDRGYIGDPDDVSLLPGAADAVRRFSAAGFRVVVVSNQSGVARGRFNEDDLEEVNARVEELLDEEGARLDGVYYCPYLDGSEAKVKSYRRKSNLRKPMPGMLLQAARELDIDLARSWMIGDSARDIEAGRRAGCRTILVGNAAAADPPADVDATYRAGNLPEAADLIERNARDSDHRAIDDSGNKDIVQVLERIHDQLDRARRSHRQQDFSLLRLFGALLQMFAIMAALWGTVALLGDDPSNATARLGLACFLQLASISAFAIDRFK